MSRLPRQFFQLLQAKFIFPTPLHRSGKATEQRFKTTKTRPKCLGYCSREAVILEHNRTLSELSARRYHQPLAPLLGSCPYIYGLWWLQKHINE